MKLVAHHGSEELEGMVRQKAYAEIRDRLRAVIWAGEGRTGEEIARRLGFTSRTIRRWITQYNAEGLEGLKDRPRSGRPPKLPRDQEAAFRARLDAGPKAEDGVSVLHGEDIRRILREEFGAAYTRGSVYDMVHRLGYSRLRPRRVHRKSDPEAMQRWIEQAPFLSRR